MNDWYPIDSPNPLSGDCLAITKDGKMVVESRIYDHKSDRYFMDNFGHENEYTHFMRLPEPPIPSNNVTISCGINFTKE